MDRMSMPTQFWNGSDGYAYPILEWIGWVRLPSIEMNWMGTPTQYWNGLDGSLYTRHCVVMISILVTLRVFALAECDRLVSEPGYREVVLFRPTGYSISEDLEEEPIKEEPLEEPNE
ncbi:hypothetical protein Tco_0024258 [Tanacetum coccineum]